MAPPPFSPLPPDKRSSSSVERGLMVLHGGWRLEEGRGAGTGCSEANPSRPVPASVLEPDVVWTVLPSHVPAAQALGEAGLSAHSSRPQTEGV